MDLSHAKNEFAEVFIRRNQQGTILIGLMQHGIVINTWIEVRNVSTL